MARRPMEPGERERREREANALAMSTWAARKTPERKRASSWNRDAARHEVSQMIASDEWEEARPMHFVELYAHLHEQVYGTAPLDLDSAKARMAAASLVRQALTKWFGGSGEEMADFMRWVWQGQSAEVRKRAAGLKDGTFRVTWRYQWGARLVADHRAAVVSRYPDKPGNGSAGNRVPRE